MPKFQSKPKIIDAEQFVDAANPCRGVHKTVMGGVEIGRFHVVTRQGMKVGVDVGEWIVAESMPDRFYPIEDDEFRRLYSPLNT